MVYIFYNILWLKYVNIYMKLNIRKINDLVEGSKYSKRELTKRCGFTRPTLDGLLNGADVKISTLTAFATFFEKPISFFFDEPIIELKKIGRDYVEKGNIEHSGTEYNSSTVINHVPVSDSDLARENAELKRKLIAAQERIIELMDKYAE